MSCRGRASLERRGARTTTISSSPAAGRSLFAPPLHHLPGSAPTHLRDVILASGDSCFCILMCSIFFGCDLSKDGLECRTFWRVLLCEERMREVSGVEKCRCCGGRRAAQRAPSHLRVWPPRQTPLRPDPCRRLGSSCTGFDSTFMVFYLDYKKNIEPADVIYIVLKDLTLTVRLIASPRRLINCHAQEKCGPIRVSSNRAEVLFVGRGYTNYLT